MPSIFIDANIILGFWSLTEGRISSELLKPLVELRQHVLVTQQVIDEVSRNKLSVFLKGSNVTFSVSFPAEFQNHLSKGTEIEELNATMRSLKTDVDDAKKRWNTIRVKIAKDICNNNDYTTEMLRPLINSVVRHTEDQLKAARERRERGNPPGKKNDRLGDQISWQQFLDAAKREESVWIITRDSDFTVNVDRQLLLNPFLRAELIERGVININVYDNLASAIKELKAAKLIEAKDLDENKLTKLEQQEADAHIPLPPYLLWPDVPWRCPRCNRVNEATGLSAHPSQYGGWSYWARCTHCGYSFDTGEPYDD